MRLKVDNALIELADLEEMFSDLPTIGFVLEQAALLMHVFMMKQAFWHFTTFSHFPKRNALLKKLFWFKNPWMVFHDKVFHENT